MADERKAEVAAAVPVAAAKSGVIMATYVGNGSFIAGGVSFSTLDRGPKPITAEILKKIGKHEAAIPTKGAKLFEIA